eukprot:scaffold63304_cov52-Phaeocystis_antarctica.AAC.1
MTDSHGDGWNGAEWAAPGFEQSFSLANGRSGAESFVVQFQSPSPPPSPPSPPSPSLSPPGTFTSKVSLKAAVLAFTENAETAIATYGPFADWDVSGVSDMSELFKEDDETYSYGGVIDGVLGFNADISNWDTSSVTDMSGMFWVRSAHGRMP